ncbi:hypothetical protein THIOSC15_1300005 [uncultured Thiomicrorhabdus sp.]
MAHASQTDTPFDGGLYVITYGCQMNEYDSDKMASLLQKTYGLALVEDPKGGCRSDEYLFVKKRRRKYFLN